MAPLVITINNKSQAAASYGIYADPPTISPTATTTTRIVASVHGVPSGQGQATIILSKQLIATCGIYDVSSDVTDPPDPKRKSVGTGVEIVDQRYVDLTTKALDGSINAGTSLEVDCSSGTPVFSTTTVPAPSVIGAFSVKMRPDFTPQQAISQKFFVRYSCSVRQDIGTYVTFVPSPGQTYQILPSQKFYVKIGAFNVRDVVKLPDQPVPDTVLVNFDDLATDRVSLVHDAYGRLNLQATPPLQRNFYSLRIANEQFPEASQTAALTTVGYSISATVEDDSADTSSVASGRLTPQGSIMSPY